MNIQNISDWIKNAAEFTVFNNTYSDGVNTLIYKGGGGYENLCFPVSCTQNVRLTFKLKFCSPTGYTCNYGDTQDYIAITKNQPTGDYPFVNYNVLARTPLSKDASNTPVEYIVSATPDYSGTAYLIIDLGYITDGVQITLVYQDIQVETDYIWHIKDNELTCSNFYTVTNSEMTKPYPKSYFRVEHDGNITSELLPELQHKEGRPLVQWYISEYKGLTNNFMPEKVLVGAFANAINLSEVVIPRSCKKIGRYAFSKTKLKLVVIASDCEYYPTSFPEGCRIKFYPD